MGCAPTVTIAFCAMAFQSVTTFPVPPPPFRSPSPMACAAGDGGDKTTAARIGQRIHPFWSFHIEPPQRRRGRRISLLEAGSTSGKRDYQLASPLWLRNRNDLPPPLRARRATC